MNIALALREEFDSYQGIVASWNDETLTNDDCLPDDIVDKFANTLLSQIEEFAASSGIDRREIDERLYIIFRAYSENHNSTESARSKWSDETKKKKAEGRRNPAQFIREEFKEELEAGTLARADLKSLDSEKLYHAYGVWIGRHPEDDLGLPTEPRTKLDEIEDVLAHKRGLSRDWWSRNKVGKASL